MATDQTKLKPCPFCNGKAEEVRAPVNAREDGIYIGCTSCEMGLAVYLPPDMAIKAWNTRTEPKETASNHLNCRERAKCGAYRPAPVCQKIHQQGCFVELG